MEDNNYRHEDFDNCFLCKHPVLKHILTGLLVFLGAFAAFYVVTDWHFKRMMDPVSQMRRIDKAIMQREKSFDKMERRALKAQERYDRKAFNAQERMERTVSGFVHVEKTPDCYKIVIILRPFDNDETNVEVKTDGNTVVINAAGEKNKHNKKEIIRFSQAFNFGEDIDTDNITKIRQRDDYIINVPID